MKTFLKIFIIITILINTLYANITKNELYNYLNVSQAGAMFLAYHIDTLDKLGNIISDKKAFNKIADDNKYSNLYADEFMMINTIYYGQIMDFYKTDVGEKYAEATYNMSKIKRNDLEKLYKQNICTDQKQIIIDKITKELNLIELKINLAKEIFYIYHTQNPENLKEAIYDIDKFEYTNQSKFSDYEKMYACIMYKDFSLKELNKILKYTSSNAGKEETKLIYKAFSKYIKILMEDAMNIIENK